MITMNHEQVRKVDLRFLDVVLSKLTLASLNEIYTFYSKTRELSSVVNNTVYVDESHETREILEHKMYVNKICMSGISFSEKIIYAINAELLDRNIDTRFGICV